jgi:hypothetical protein
MKKMKHWYTCADCGVPYREQDIVVLTDVPRDNEEPAITGLFTPVLGNVYRYVCHGCIKHRQGANAP